MITEIFQVHRELDSGRVRPKPPWLGWPFWNICVTNDHAYVPIVVNTSRSFPHSRLITGFVTRLPRRVPLVEQELPTLPEYLSSSPVCSEVRVIRSLVLYVCFVDRYLSFWPFPFGHCVVCFSSIYRFWLPPFVIFKLVFKICICCFFFKHAVLNSKTKTWLARNQNNMSEWSDMSTRGLLFYWASMMV